MEGIRIAQIKNSSNFNKDNLNGLKHVNKV